MAVVTTRVCVGDQRGLEIVRVACRQIQYGWKGLIDVAGGPEHAADGFKNSFFAMWWLGLPWSSISPLFWLGLVLILVGGYLVLTNKPDAEHGAPRLDQGRVDRRKTDKEPPRPWDELKRPDRADAERPARRRHAF